MLKYVIHSQFVKVELDVCVVPWLFKFFLNLIILCLCLLTFH